MLIAHRGKVTNNTKENTLEAFLEAINDNKYQGFELDIRTTKDKKIVIVHDFFSKNNLISKTNYQDLENIPLLEDALKLETNKIILIEIKEKDIDIDILNNLLVKYSNRNIYVMSFYDMPIKNLLKLKPNYKCGILNYLFNSEVSYQEYDFIGLLDNTITPNLLEYFKRRKITLFSYGIVNKTLKYPEDVYYIVDETYFKEK